MTSLAHIAFIVRIVLPIELVANLPYVAERFVVTTDSHLLRYMPRMVIPMKTLCSLTIWLACSGMLLPGFVFAEPGESDSSHFTQDVALNAAGELRGQVVNRGAVALADVELTLVSDIDGMKLKATTDAEGKFAFANVRGSVCEISSGAFKQKCRVWVVNTAPPAASKGLLIVAEKTQVQRGQSNNCNCQNNNCNCQNNNTRRQRNPRRRKLLFAGGKIGMRAAMIPFMAAGALGVADDEEDTEVTDGEDGGGDNGDTGSAS